MSPELITAIGVVLAAVLGPAGVSALRRRADADGPVPSPATEVRDAAPALAALAASLTAAETRADELEGSVWRCPVQRCPVRDHLRREGP